jgi:3-dehydroquinate synthase
MKSIRVNLKRRSYDIIIGNKILKDCGQFLSRLNIDGDAYIITNSLVKNKYGKILEVSLKKKGMNARFKEVADSEKSKSIRVAFSIIKDITKFDKGKKIFIIALGGGVIGDLAGFIASIYKRGIPYVQVPTTLLAQIDSSIGGKTAVDLMEAKNLVGAFYQPRMVLSDISCLRSLTKRQIRSGLAEAVKYGIIKDRALFKFLEKNYQLLLNRNEERLEFLVYRCSKIKATVVQKDETERKGIRTILNFGHTFGHAIEAASNYKGYNHGEAVALGMLCATELSLGLGLIKADTFKRVLKLIRAIGLPTKIKNVSIEKIIAAHYRDKKFLGRENRFVLIKALGLALIKKNIELSKIKTVLLKRA